MRPVKKSETAPNRIAFNAAKTPMMPRASSALEDKKETRRQISQQQLEGAVLMVDYTRNTWTVAMAAAWAGIPQGTLYRLLREGIVPCIRMGAAQTQRFSTAKNGTRERSCYRFVIPRVAFMKAWETIGNTESHGNPPA